MADNFEREEFALACSLGELVLVDMLVKIKKDARIFVIDTGLLFKETYALKEEAEKSPMEFEPPPTQAMATSGAARPVCLRNCARASRPMTRWKSRTMRG